jgi:DNA polymerase IV
MRRTILHIDFDSFFASVEQQDNPTLRCKPVGVTATNGRTCIIAASREAKGKGIKSPSRTVDALKLCPDIQFVPAKFVRYWEISKKFIALCDKFSPTVEVFSLDEVFMDVTQSARLFGGVYPLIEAFKKRLSAEVGECITASVGIAPNKLLAKLASGMKKPNGVVEIDEKNLWAIYNKSELTDICGIGYGISRRLNQMGITRLLQLRFVPLQSLIAEFGEVEGKILYDIGLGIDERPVISYTEKPDVKSVGRQYCLPLNQYNQRKVVQNVYELCEEVALKLRRLGKKAKRVGVYLSGSSSIYGKHTGGYYFNTGTEVFEHCLKGLQEASGVDDISKHDAVLSMIPEYVRRVHIWASYLEDTDNLPTPLLPQDQKQQRLTKIVDTLNDRFGDHTIRNGFLLYADKLTTVPNGYGTDRYDRTQLAQKQI